MTFAGARAARDSAAYPRSDAKGYIRAALALTERDEWSKINQTASNVAFSLTTGRKEGWPNVLIQELVRATQYIDTISAKKKRGTQDTRDAMSDYSPVAEFQPGLNKWRSKILKGGTRVVWVSRNTKATEAEAEREAADQIKRAFRAGDGSFNHSDANPRGTYEDLLAIARRATYAEDTRNGVNFLIEMDGSGQPHHYVNRQKTTPASFKVAYDRERRNAKDAAEPAVGEKRRDNVGRVFTCFAVSGGWVMFTKESGYRSRMPLAQWLKLEVVK